MLSRSNAAQAHSCAALPYLIISVRIGELQRRTLTPLGSRLMVLREERAIDLRHGIRD